MRGGSTPFLSKEDAPPRKGGGTIRFLGEQPGPEDKHHIFISFEKKNQYNLLSEKKKNPVKGGKSSNIEGKPFWSNSHTPEPRGKCVLEEREPLGPSPDSVSYIKRGRGK